MAAPWLVQFLPLLITIFTISGVLSQNISDHPGAADQGNWTVEDCVMVRLASQITLYPNPKNKNETVIIELPVTAIASGFCGKPEVNQTEIMNQKITLDWFEVTDANVTLNRNLTLEFSKNSAAQKYGVSKIQALYVTRIFDKNVTDPNTNETSLISVTEYVSMTTFRMDPWEFLVPLNRSYLCLDVGTRSMHTELHLSHKPLDETKLPNSTFSAKKVQLDAFRAEDAPLDEYQIGMDCTYRPNDVVPIIVGCALAGLVVMVLVAYLVGRRRSRARGYQSV